MKTKAKQQARITEHTWDMLHVAFVTPQKPGINGDPPTFKELARTFGVPFQEADRRAYLGRWEIEREANRSRQWLECYGGSATTEAELLERWGEDALPLMSSKGPEGKRLVKARAHRIWIDVSSAIAKWDAFVEEKAAEEAFDAVRGRMAA